MTDVFQMDGKVYDVDVVELRRDFAVEDTENSGKTMDGAMYREPLGTYYHYTMTVRAKPGNRTAMDDFWEAISQPVVSHVCTFPYGQRTLTQRMYVTSGEQALVRMSARGNLWGEASVSFTAIAPKVLP